MIVKGFWSAQTKDPSGSWQARYFGADFDDREGFGTAWSTKSFMIMERALGGRVADCSANVLRDTAASCVTRVDRNEER
jgi:hypothetical protein